MKILAIGNSFSQDATRYLHGIASSFGDRIKVVNLYIGGCSLSTHYNNMVEDKKAYAMEFNGVSTGFYVSIKEALVSDSWDVVTLQQVSSASVKYSSYKPYIDELAAYVREHCGSAKIYIHQTWAYEEGSERLCTEMGYKTEKDMLCDIKASYECAAKDVDACGIIPSGEVMHLLHSKIPAVHRDTFHASWGVGRFALALTWYSYLMEKDISSVKFSGFDAPVSEEEYKAVVDSVSAVCGK